MICVFIELLDIDECYSDQHDCDVNAECINTDGSFNCSCRDGYMGNGTSCCKSIDSLLQYERATLTKTWCYRLQGW